MNNISCDLCMDLIPLVKDGIASGDSCSAVMEHIDSCAQCKAEYGQVETGDTTRDDGAIVGKLKRGVLQFLVIAMLVGGLFGVVISDGAGMFYNILIMPTIGAIGYIVFRKRAYIPTLSIFVVVAAWVFGREALSGFLGRGATAWVELLQMSLMWAVIYTALVFVGVVAAWLFCYGLKREG